MDSFADLSSLEGPTALEGTLKWVLELPPGPGRTARIQQLARFLEANPVFAAALREAWSHASAIRLLAETGLPDQPSFLAEGLQRFLDSLIPRLDSEGDLYSLLNRLELSEADAEWLLALDPAGLGPLPGLLADEPEHRQVRLVRRLDREDRYNLSGFVRKRCSCLLVPDCRKSYIFLPEQVP